MNISVIIPTYKPQSYIWECLDSLDAQTFPKNEFEIILVLNGCKEPYEDEIKKYMAIHSDLNLKFIQTDQGGVSNARNLALDIAQGEYITFIDDDDYVSRKYLDGLWKKVSPNVVALAKPISIDDQTKMINLAYSVTIEYEKWALKGKQLFYYPRKYFSGPCMKLIHRDIIGNRRYDTSFRNGEDSIFMFQISDRMEYVDFTDDQSIYYRRIRLGSAISNNDDLKYRIKNSFLSIKAYVKIYINNPFHYRFIFLVSRILGAFHTMLHNLR